MIEDISDASEPTVAEGMLPLPDVELRPTGLRQRYELHLPLHAHTHSTRGEFVAALQQIRDQHHLSCCQTDALCQEMEQFMPEAGRLCRPVRTALQLNLMSRPLKLDTEPNITGYCEACRTSFVPTNDYPQGQECDSSDRVHLLVSRSVAEALRLALRLGKITISGRTFGSQQDGIELLMSIKKYGSIRSLVLDVLNNSQPTVRIIAAIMHSPMDIGNRHQRPDVSYQFFNFKLGWGMGVIKIVKMSRNNPPTPKKSLHSRTIQN